MTSSNNISFSHTLYFGEGFANIKRSSMLNCVLTNLVMDGILNFDGTMDEDAVSLNPRIRKRDLWAYVYYLWKHNHKKHAVFARMTAQRRGKTTEASATGFVTSVRLELEGIHAIDIQPFLSKQNVAMFVNHIVRINGDKLINPLLISMFDRMETMFKQKDLKLRQELTELNARVIELNRLVSNTNQTRLFNTDKNGRIQFVASNSRTRGRNVNIQLTGHNTQ